MSINFERFKLKLNNGTDIYPEYAIFSSDIINYLKGNRRTECNCFEITNTSPISDFSISIEEEDIVVKDKQIFVQKSLIFRLSTGSGSGTGLEISAIDFFIGKGSILLRVALREIKYSCSFCLASR